MRSRGTQRERAVTGQLQALGYLVASMRHIGGPGDLLAIAPDKGRMLTVTPSGTVDLASVGRGEAVEIYGEPSTHVRHVPAPRPLLVEVKGTTKVPWHSGDGFSPQRRAEMISAGISWRVEPMLCWWPPGLLGGPIYLPVEDWPNTNEGSE